MRMEATSAEVTFLTTSAEVTFYYELKHVQVAVLYSEGSALVCTHVH